MCALACAAAPCVRFVRDQRRPDSIVFAGLSAHKARFPDRPEPSASLTNPVLQDARKVSLRMDGALRAVAPLLLASREKTRELQDWPGAGAVIHDAAVKERLLERARNIGARHLIFGEVRRCGSQYEVALRAIPTRTGNAAEQFDWRDAKTFDDAPPPPPPPGYAEDLGANVGMDMVWIPGGSCLLGSPPEEPGRGADEGPRREVALSGFWMGRTEVTQRQFEQVMGRNPSWMRAPDRPVESVRWEDAMEFCRRLSIKTGHAYTLPTEAQGEYATRAGSQESFCFGADARNLESHAWYLGVAGDETHPPGLKAPNAFGLHDVHGNVAEWRRDWYQADFYQRAPRLNPVQMAAGEERVVRGGSFFSRLRDCRSAKRGKMAPWLHCPFVGFRVVREVESGPSGPNEAKEAANP